ncbi:CorA-like Mg2+ transporter domain-containing protein [Histoplasma ohiense]|nr:CorA-like Mg2+ transporter domain-containing protein [Histoplasma ohiense (nom. inval.)]
MPWQISDGLPICASGPLGRIKPVINSYDFRILSSHPAFLDAQLVRNEFRFFHRSDGFLLTMSAAKGVNYLDARLREYLRQSPDDILLNPGASAVGQTLREFASTGTSTWEKPTAEWLVVHLATEIGTCPHNDTLGHNQISVVEAYQDILRDLVCRSVSRSSIQDSAILTRIYQKLRTYEPWRRDETVRLTRTFLQCMEEIRFISKMLESRQNLFTRLKEDIKKHDEEDRNHGIPHNPDGESCMHRVDWTLGKIRQQRDDIENIAHEIKNSMNDLLHLRTIEQNELTIVRDSQQRAIMLFTAVTVIFLPLSFCTSYFGMNLQGISDTARSERYFWYVCGTAGFAIVSVISIYAFWHPVKDYLMVLREQRKSKRFTREERKRRLKRRISSENV